MFHRYTLPFDRHDWIVDRCGKEVKYVLDFYQGKEEPDSPASIYLDIRPAVSFGGVIDRSVNCDWRLQHPPNPTFALQTSPSMETI
jgi:hypothetical protein